MVVTLACALLMAGPPGPGASSRSPSLPELRAQADRILRDLAAGRDEAVVAMFLDEAQPKAGPALRALGEQRAQLGSFVRIEDARLLADARIGGKPLVVLDADVRYEKEMAFAELGFVRIGSRWRLRGLNIAVVADERPPLADASAPGAARKLLQEAQERGLARLVDAIPPAARDKPDDEMRAVADRPQALLGRLRSFELGELEFAWYRCRKVTARSRFEHGAGSILLTLCPHGDAWRPFAVEIEPEMTPALFGKTVRMLASSVLERPDAAVQCPATVPPIGGTVTCRLRAGGRARELRVRRTSNSGIEVEGLEQGRR